MKRFISIGGLLIAALIVGGCQHWLPSDGWTTVIDGDKGLENFNRVGDANWRAEGGAIVADKGKGGHLVTKKSYKDFEIRAEFWAATNTNSGIYFRIADPRKISNDNSYEANIYDQRPGADYGTAALMNLVSVPVPTVYKAGGKWNVLQIRAKGDEITVIFNETVTAYTRDSKHKQGPFSLQFGNVAKGAPGGPIKWRKVLVREI